MLLTTAVSSSLKFKLLIPPRNKISQRVVIKDNVKAPMNLYGSAIMIRSSKTYWVKHNNLLSNKHLIYNKLIPNIMDV